MNSLKEEYFRSYFKWRDIFNFSFGGLRNYSFELHCNFFYGGENSLAEALLSLLVYFFVKFQQTSCGTKAYVSEMAQSCLQLCNVFVSMYTYVNRSLKSVSFILSHLSCRYKSGQATRKEISLDNKKSQLTHR